MSITRAFLLGAGLLGVGCRGESSEPHTENVVTEAPPELTAGKNVETLEPILDAAVVMANCELGERNRQLYNDLVIIATGEYTHPRVPLRATECLMILFPQWSQPMLETWVTSTRQEDALHRRIILTRLDVLPPEIALAVFDKALTGPDATTARNTARYSKYDALRARIRKR